MSPSFTDLRLAEQVALRLCRELAAPLPTLVAAAAQSTDAEAQAVLLDALADLRRRHRLLSAAFGPAEEMTGEEVQEALRGSPAAHRVRFELDIGHGHLPPGVGRLLLAACLLAAEALPRGGIARVADLTPGCGYAIRPEGRDAAWPEALLALVTSDNEAPAPEEEPAILSAWLVRLAGSEGVGLHLAAPSGARPQPPALVLALPG